MEQPLLDIAIIVKNEEHFLAECLQSIAELGDAVHEVCIYDTGSTDRTVEIAHSRGARVELGYWDDDFARARNAAASMCTATWVLVVDADERVRANPGTIVPLLEFLLAHEGGPFEAAALANVSLGPSGHEEGRVNQLRLYRPECAAYAGRVHETLQPVPPNESLRQVNLALEIIRLDHVGYADKGRIAAKAARNLRLADRGRRDHSDELIRQRSAVDYARSLLALNRAEAIAELRHAWETLTIDDYRRQAGEYLADALCDEGSFWDAERLAALLVREGSQPEFCDWVMGRALAGQGRHREALTCLRNVNRPTMTGGIGLETGAVLRARMHSALPCGEREEALRCCLTLVSGKDQRPEDLPFLLGLWTPRPAHELAALLAGADRDGGNLGPLCRALDGAGGVGPHVAAHLRATRADVVF